MGMNTSDAVDHKASHSKVRRYYQIALGLDRIEQI